MKNIGMHNFSVRRGLLNIHELRDFGRNVSYTFGETLTLSRAICIRKFASEARFPLRISCETASCTKKHDDVPETAKQHVA